ncbi:MAG TPA: hypothetical protein VIF57_05360 [Polyangia bacterium]
MQLDSRSPSVDDRVFRILPGQHLITVALDDEPPAGGRGRRTSQGALAVCAEVKAMHLYRVRPAYDGDRWGPEIFDETAGAVIPASVQKPENAHCVTGPSGLVDPFTATAATLERSGASSAQIEAAVAQMRPDPGATRVHVQSDADIRAGRGFDETYVPRSTLDLHMDLGYAGGGRDLVTATFANGEESTLSSGDGLILALGADFTPIWIGDVLGLGAGATFGLKYAEVGASNGRVSLLRFPLAATMNVFVGVSRRWLLLFRAGVVEDTNARLTGNGVANLPDIPLSSSLGFIGEAGVAFARGDHLGMSLTMRITAIDYSYGGETIPAANIGVVMSLYYNHWR